VALETVAQLEVNADRPGQRLERATAVSWRERHDVVAAAEPVNRLIVGVGIAGPNEIFMRQLPADASANAAPGALPWLRPSNWSKEVSSYWSATGY